MQDARHSYMPEQLYGFRFVLLGNAPDASCNLKQTGSRKVIYDTVSIHARCGYAVYQIQSLAPCRPHPLR